MHRGVPVVLALIAACSGDDAAAPDAAVADAAPARLVYVVRHAETGSTATDPPLDATGQPRAMTLASVLGGMGIAKIYPSQDRRTQETGMPIATAGLTVDVRTVDGTDAATYGSELATAARDARVALTGVAVPAITETQYDRLFTITLLPVGGDLVEGTYR